jgi:hypothetical protein
LRPAGIGERRIEGVLPRLPTGFCANLDSPMAEFGLRAPSRLSTMFRQVCGEAFL